jgi:uncharacterized protein YjaG (DUF416 family)
MKSLKEIKKEQLQEKIINLNPESQLSFAIILCERFLPNYFAFYLMEHWGNPMVLLNAVDLLKNVVLTNNWNDPELLRLDQLTEEITPDMDDFPANTLASLALDVSSMIHECFCFAQTQQGNHIWQCSQIVFSSLEMYIQKRDNLRYDLTYKELTEHLNNDKLILNEITFQNDLLDELKNTIKISNKLFIDKSLLQPSIQLYAKAAFSENLLVYA